jgi:aminoglycoside phosphotransferase (APT) family kinase protein
MSTSLDEQRIKETFARWLTKRMDTGGDGVSVSAVSGIVGGGYSGDMVTLDAVWTAPDGEPRRESLVVRFEPSEGNQIFLDTNFEPQYRVIEALGQHSEVAVPGVVGLEIDPALVGRRFYVMRWVDGVPGPIGSTWSAAVDERGADAMWPIWWNGLAAMAELHRVRPDDVGLQLLNHPSRGADPIEQQLDYYRENFDWVARGASYPVISRTLDWLDDNNPRIEDVGISWGDARRGNQLFGADGRCNALLDWEMVGLGPAETDLAYWMYTTEIEGREPLGAHTPTAEQTVHRYEALLGRPLRDLGYFRVFAALRISVLMVKLKELRGGHVDGFEEVAGEPALGRALDAQINGTRA